MVIIHHLYKYYASNCGFSPASSILHIWGYTSVGVFFFLSGYGMTVSLMKYEGAYVSYLKKSILKLFMPYIFTLLIGYTLSMFVDKKNCLDVTKEWIRISFNPWIIWYVKALLAEYVVLIVSFIFIKKRMMISLVSFTVTGVYALFANKVLHLQPYLTCTLIIFPLGVIYALHFKQINNIKISNKIIWLTTSIIVYFLTKKTIGDIYVSRMVLSIAFTCISIIAVSIINIRFVWLTTLGKDSLYYYLFHITLLLPITNNYNVNEYVITGYIIICTHIIVFLYKNLFGINNNALNQLK